MNSDTPRFTVQSLKPVPSLTPTSPPPHTMLKKRRRSTISPGRTGPDNPYRGRYHFLGGNTPARWHFALRFDHTGYIRTRYSDTRMRCDLFTSTMRKGHEAIQKIRKIHDAIKIDSDRSPHGGGMPILSHSSRKENVSAPDSLKCAGNCGIPCRAPRPGVLAPGMESDLRFLVARRRTLPISSMMRFPIKSSNTAG